DLQSQDWLGAQTGHPNSEIKEEIVKTALDYRLMSQYTSFVAVEQRVVNVGGKQRTVDVPVESPEGISYDGIFGGAEAKSSSLNGTPAIMGAVSLYYRAAPSGGMAGAVAKRAQAAGPAGPAGPPASAPTPNRGIGGLGGGSGRSISG